MEPSEGVEQRSGNTLAAVLRKYWRRSWLEDRETCWEAIVVIQTEETVAWTRAVLMEMVGRNWSMDIEGTTLGLVDGMDVRSERTEVKDDSKAF